MSTKSRFQFTFLFFFCGFSTLVFSMPPDFSVCTGLSGAARGLCRAGVAAGCADATGDREACASIEMNFTDQTGDLPPWITPIVECPCDYRSLVPQTAAEWSDEAGNPKVIVLNCDSMTAQFQAVSPLPQLPAVTALLTSQIPPQRICQAVPNSGLGEVAGELTAEELAACRNDVLDYASEMLTLYPSWPWVDNCSTP